MLPLSFIVIRAFIFMYVLQLFLQKLQVFSLRENKIRSLPANPGIERLTQLMTLDVSHNHLETLPEGGCLQPIDVRNCIAQ